MRSRLIDHTSFRDPPTLKQWLTMNFLDRHRRDSLSVPASCDKERSLHFSADLHSGALF